MRIPFLTAEWRKLLILSYEVNSATLLPFLPSGTVLDNYNGRALVSIVGFQFLRARVGGLPFPFFQSFAQINLRFYVTSLVEGCERRGVVFIKEVCPHRVVSGIAWLCFNEKFQTMPSSYKLDEKTISYGWGREGQRCWIRAKIPCCTAMAGCAADSGALATTLCDQGSLTEVNLTEGSLADFIVNRYYGYSVLRNGQTLEFQVEHEPWEVLSLTDCRVSDNAAMFYGQAFAATFRARPASILLVEGSPIKLFRGSVLSAHNEDDAMWRRANHG